MIREALDRSRRRCQLDRILAEAAWLGQESGAALEARLRRELAELDRTRKQDEAELDAAWEAMRS